MGFSWTECCAPLCGLVGGRGKSVLSATSMAGLGVLIQNSCVCYEKEMVRPERFELPTFWFVA